MRVAPDPGCRGTAGPIRAHYPDAVPILALKLILTPILIGSASLAGRRWGPAIGGWLVSLPLTSGPVTFFLALDRGTAFASTSAVGSLMGLMAIAGFTLAFAGGLIRSGPRTGILLAVVAFAAIGLLVQPILDGPPWILFLVVIAALGAALRLLPPSGIRGSPAPHPLWDLPARVAIGTGLVVGLTGVAPLLGAHTSGVVATFPVYVSILTLFTHRLEGLPGALDVLRGLLVGLFGTAAFLLILAVEIEPLGIGPAFGLAIGFTLVIQAVALRTVRAGAGRPVELESV
jgi:hypothetical protein